MALFFDLPVQRLVLVHPERSEGSALNRLAEGQILRFAQDDNRFADYPQNAIPTFTIRIVGLTSSSKFSPPAPISRFKPNPAPM